MTTKNWSTDSNFVFTFVFSIGNVGQIITEYGGLSNSPLALFFHLFHRKYIPFHEF